MGARSKMGSLGTRGWARAGIRGSWVRGQDEGPSVDENGALRLYGDLGGSGMAEGAEVGQRETAQG